MVESGETVGASATRTAHELRAVVGRLRRRLRDVGDRRELTPSQTAVLGRLAKDGAGSTSDLAAAERVRAQSMATILAALDERGMILRQADPHDGRRHLVSLSPAGHDYVAGRRAAGEEWLARALQERFDDAERDTLLAAIALLDRLVQR